jgi:hypothetical protein
VGGQHHAPAALPPWKTLYPLYRRLGGPQDRSGRVRKISPPPRFDPRTVQSVVSRYTDWAIRPTLLQWKINKYYIFCDCVCSLRYPACGACAPYCHLWRVRLYNIRPHYLKKRHDFRKKVEHNVCFLVSIPFAWNISDYKKVWAKYDQKCNLSSCKAPVILVRF